MRKREYMLGNVAIARGIVEGGGQVISGYPGTPSSEIIGTLAIMKERDFYVEWSVNEKVALEVAAGASMAGVRSVVTMKHVGLNVAADPLMTLAYTGIKGSMVIIVADDPSCHSSQNEQDTRRYSQFSLIPCLDPCTPQEAKDMMPYAFEISNRLQIPVIFRPTTRISHGKSDVELGPVCEDRPAADFRKDLQRWVMVPSNARVQHGRLLELQKDILDELGDSPWNKLDIREDTRLGVIASGIASVYAREAIIKQDVDASFLKIGTCPVPVNKIRTLLENTDTVIVFEEMEPVVEEQVRIIAQETGSNVEIIGKIQGPVPRIFELNADICADVLAEVLGLERTDVPIDTGEDFDYDACRIELPMRPPVMCPGCSHRATFHVMKKVYGKDAIFPSDIGCYTLGIQSGTVDTTLCMGGSITVASGMYQAGEKKPICCSIGDSTFFHTGMNGLLNAIYNKADITVTIVDNRITAMTGHQPNPGMGKTATGEDTVAVSLEALCRSMGAGFVQSINPYDLKQTEEVFKRAKDYKGTSVVITNQLCVIDAKRSGIRRKPFTIDADECVGCKLCVNLGCPAIEFDIKSKKASINIMCTGCGVCASMCKFDAIYEVKK
ncbi:indolepyruvate ferredoxin oxidoreductase subunit alpha [Methanolobus halotolerans]|uniref:Indolepyruvate oxidoreductase subunit IorA n=1 Tax=Methanolobus halotolerans TaxID=2052935 RepID=A0A4E0PUE4_9EURY|nr:indolepyruvate ferredoxin oxidoreductase subunit alpha [Methanolobus halotolerans]TGC08455.1 indolepyruvate ferredoxin oxidoreductase subunit alpha [Methanolobus halotolerans]